MYRAKYGLSYTQLWLWSLWPTNLGFAIAWSEGRHIGWELIPATSTEASLRAGDWIGGRLQTAGELLRWQIIIAKVTLERAPGAFRPFGHHNTFWPELMIPTCPVIYVASTRNRARSATSSGSPIRPRGIRLNNCVFCSSTAVISVLIYPEWQMMNEIHVSYCI